MELKKICKKCGASVYSDTRCGYCGTQIEESQMINNSSEKNDKIYGNKYCHRCGEEKTIEGFGWHNTKTGKERLRYRKCTSQSCLKYYNDFNAKEKRDKLIGTTILLFILLIPLFLFIYRG